MAKAPRKPRAKKTPTVVETVETPAVEVVVEPTPEPIVEPVVEAEVGTEPTAPADAVNDAALNTEPVTTPEDAWNTLPPPRPAPESNWSEDRPVEADSESTEKLAVYAVVVGLILVIAWYVFW